MARIVSLIGILVLGTQGTGHSQILVTGWDSHNIVHFNLQTGDSFVYATLPEGSSPKTVAIDADGNLYVPLRYHTGNVVKLTPRADGEGFITTDFTPRIGQFGPGMVDIDPFGNLVVAGDSARQIYRYSLATGQLVDSFGRAGSGNILGLDIDGDTVFACEIFQGIISSFNLARIPNPGEGLVVIDDPDRISRPEGICVGHANSILVSNTESPLILRYHRSSGVFLGNFLDVTTLGLESTPNIEFSHRTQRYYVPKDDKLYEFDTDGQLTRTFYSPDLLDGRGIGFLDEPSTAPLIRSFSATPNAIQDGESAVLSWDVIDEEHIEINQGIGDVSGLTSVVVQPSDTTTYRLSATNMLGTRLRHVTVEVLGPPRIEGFTADPAKAVQGEPSTLRWQVSRAKRVILSPGIGEVASSGMLEVRPEETTLYRLQATNDLGTVISIVEITITPKLQPMLRSISLNASGIIRIQISDEEPMDIECSSDLKNWSPLAEGVMGFLEVPRAPFGPVQFFRGVRFAE